MPGGGIVVDPIKSISVDTLALRNAYPTGLRRIGMAITVTADATSTNNGTWRLLNGVDNADWVRESDYVSQVTKANIRKKEVDFVRNGATSASEVVVADTEIADGESVTITATVTGKDDDTNTGVGVLFLATWTKAAGTLQKVADTTIASQNDIGGTLTVSTSDTSGSIALSVQLVSATGNFSFVVNCSILFRKAS